MVADRDAGIDPRFDPVFQRGYDAGKHRRRPAPRVEERREATRLETTPEETQHPDPSVVSTGSTTDRRNPFRLILLLVSIAAIGGAVAMLWHRITADPFYYSGPVNDQQAYFVDTLLTALLPALTLGGLVGVVLWLAIGAVRRPEHRSGPDD